MYGGRLPRGHGLYGQFHSHGKRRVCLATETDDLYHDSSARRLDESMRAFQSAVRSVIRAHGLDAIGQNDQHMK